MRFLRVLASLALLLAACGGPAGAPNSNAAPSASASAVSYPLTVTDDRGKTLTLSAAPRRIVSLAPSATEIVFALGAAELLVAVDDYSDFPADTKKIPHIGGTRTSPEVVVSHKPDLILAISSGNLPAQLDALNQPLFVFSPENLDGVYRNISLVGSMLDRESQAKAVVTDMRTRIDAVAAKAKTATAKPRVLHEVDATNPVQVFVAGPRNFIDSIITAAGGVNVAADAAVKFPKLSPEEVVARNPDIIILADAKFGASVETVRARPGWSAVTAVRQGAIYPIDDDLVSRPGPRLAQGFEAYLQLLHPELK